MWGMETGRVETALFFQPYCVTALRKPYIWQSLLDFLFFNKIRLSNSKSMGSWFSALLYNGNIFLACALKEFSMHVTLTKVLTRWLVYRMIRLFFTYAAKSFTTCCHLFTWCNVPQLRNQWALIVCPNCGWHERCSCAIQTNYLEKKPYSMLSFQNHIGPI